jgi:hypothetical protein
LYISSWLLNLFYILYTLYISSWLLYLLASNVISCHYMCKIRTDQSGYMLLQVQYMCSLLPTIVRQLKTNVCFYYIRIYISQLHILPIDHRC